MPKKLFYLSLVIFLCFILFSYLVAKETFVKLDFDTTVKFQDNIPHIFDLPFSIFSVLGSAEISMVIWLGLVVWMALKKWWKVVLSLMLLPLALAIEVFGKLFVYHPGPPHLFYRGVIHFDFPSSYVPVNYAYPSGHLTRTAFIITFLICYLYFRKKTSPTLGVLGLLGVFGVMFISRIYLGEHWLSDVIGGSLIGSAFGLLAGLTLFSKNSKGFV